MPDVPVFDVAGLTKVHGRERRVANDDLTLSIARGEIFGILGDNGAGKTTLVRQMAGLIAPTSGELRFMGTPVEEAERELTTQVGYMPQSAFALNNLTVSEAIFFTARFRGLSRRAARGEVARLLSQWAIEPLANRVAKQLSGGQRRLLQLAVTMAGSPPVLILDEPTNDLDPVNRKRVWHLLTAANQDGATIIFVTHDAVEAEKVVHRVAIMRQGRIVALGRPLDLKQEIGHRFRLELIGTPGDPPAPLARVHCTEVEPGRWLAILDKADVGEIMTNLDMQKFDDVRLSSSTLEDLYLHYATT
ncbi:ABC transporter ATP-binding protein [Streptosporangium sp. NPDC051023]|uniref:ABC transporter ATP-binding protein n=1 Tax=Streptosporangium sp. NPDC051023 TaxID=3155410 RepID=UPI00344D864E